MTKIIFYTLIPLTFIASSYKKSMAQKIIKKDTIYYLIDTANVPINDRMITIESAKEYKFYSINCPCLNNSIKPIFRCNITNQVIMKRSMISSLKFIHLPDLIELVKKKDNGYFNDNFVIFFIEPYKRKYIKHRVFFSGSSIRQVD